MSHGWVHAKSPVDDPYLGRIEWVRENNTKVKMVSIKIVHSDSQPEENC